MKRRLFLFGSATGGAGLLFGTSAFSASGVGHTVSIGTGNGHFHVELNDDYAGDASEYVVDTNPIRLILDDLHKHGWIRFDDLLRVTNTETQAINVHVKDQDWLGDDTDAVLDYRYDGSSIVGKENSVPLEGVSGDNSMPITVRADTTDHDDLQQALPDAEADDGDRTVMFVASPGDANGGTGDESDEEEVTKGGENLSVSAPGQVTVGSDNHFTATATVSDGDYSGKATVTLNVEDELVDEQTVTVPEDEPAEATFDVPTVYNDLATENIETGRHGPLRFDGTDWSAGVEYGESTAEASGTLEVEDAPITFGNADCAVCEMPTKGYVSAHAQLTHANGDRMEFCSTGCLVAYAVDPVEQDGPDEPIEGVWVVDFTNVDSDGKRAGDGTDLINAHEAYFVLDYDTSYGAMTGNPHAFTTKDDAVSYVNTHDDLNEKDDIIRFDEFDADIAANYRSSHISS
ncbi:nitrous oxide reductase accessory protein NosL [Natrinema limicola]|uniref:NosL family protein n=1 Tax=Natrinema limicola JCM 13563 TaxID=1230457 RepID=M0CQA5_9EURY|nr:nitrous oxide reductase accessory protein NosL [Natrinema limicola]ELZ24039.1 hypothetical protein C476_04800 [Natrinema limicola JCM 13563]